MPAIVAYKLITSFDPAKVEARVNELIVEHWQPYGPPFFGPLEERFQNSGMVPVVQLMQAMVQYEYQGNPLE